MKSAKRKNSTPVERASADLVGEKVERLKEVFPEAFVEGKVDFEKLKATLGEVVDDGPERYSFTWAGKRDAIRLLQVASRATLKPCPQESVDWETTKNVFIEGENMEVLKLLYKSYAGRVKMIYIDPPYNTGNDFIYPDNFADPLDTYLKLTGQKDAEGNLLTSNPETSGRYHSAWLSMMYPRLFVARQLLSKDGLLFVSIDDNEMFDLRMLMNELFGGECFKNCIVFRRGIKSVQAQFETVDALTVGHEYVLMYARDPGSRFKHLTISLEQPKAGTWNNHWRGTDRPTMRYELLGIKPDSGQWRWSEERSLEAVYNYKTMVRELRVRPEQITQDKIDEWYRKQSQARGRDIDLLRLSSSGKPEHYVPPSNVKLGSDLWADLSPRGTPELEGIFGGKVFDNPKPLGLIRRMLGFATEPCAGHIALDFFAGSCTTAHAVLEQNREDGGMRRFLMIQLQEPLDESAERGANAQRLGLKTIADIGKERIRRVIKKFKEQRDHRAAKAQRERGLFHEEMQGESSVSSCRGGENEDLGFRVFKLAESNYRQWRGVEKKDGETYAETMEMFADPLLPAWKPEDVIWEVALKEGYGLSSTVEEAKGIKGNRVWKVADPDREQSFHICLDDELKASTVNALKLGRDDLFVCRDAALTDEQAANLALQCRLKTI
jgi:adenine-specific DNA-methyltransferase